jgi:hypothetical protein
MQGLTIMKNLFTDNRIFEDEEHQILPPPPRAKLSGPIELKFCMGNHRQVLFEMVEAFFEFLPQGHVTTPREGPKMAENFCPIFSFLLTESDSYVSHWS